MPFTIPNPHKSLSINGAGDETRTRDIFLGKEVLYQLSYTRVKNASFPGRPAWDRPAGEAGWKTRGIPRGCKRFFAGWFPIHRARKVWIFAAGFAGLGYPDAHSIG